MARTSTKTKTDKTTQAPGAAAPAAAARAERAPSLKAAIKVTTKRVSELKEHPHFNVRIDVEKNPKLKAHIEALTASMLADGFDSGCPIEIDSEGFIVDGHCRLKAAQAAGLDKVHVYTKEYADEADKASRMLVKNNGLGLSPLEKGEVYLRLMEGGWGQARIARAGEVTDAAVSQAIVIARTPVGIKSLIEDGKVASTEVYKLINHYGTKGEAPTADVYAKVKTVLDVALELAQEDGKSKASGKHIKAALESVDGAPAAAPGSSSSNGNGSSDGSGESTGGSSGEEIEVVDSHALAEELINSFISSEDGKTYSITITAEEYESLLSRLGA